jgi:hypothetical protein
MATLLFLSPTLCPAQKSRTQGHREEDSLWPSLVQLQPGSCLSSLQSQVGWNAKVALPVRMWVTLSCSLEHMPAVH